MKCLPFCEHFKESRLSCLPFYGMLRAFQNTFCSCRRYNNALLKGCTAVEKIVEEKFASINYILYICIVIKRYRVYIKKYLKKYQKIFASVN